MAKRQAGGVNGGGGGAVLNRMAGKTIHFSGKFDWGVREQLEGMAAAHKGKIAGDLDAAVDYLVIPDLSGGKTIQDKARRLNAKGAAIQTIDAVAFGQMLEVMPDEALALVRGGAPNAEAFARAVSDPRRALRTQGATATYTFRNENFDGIDLTGFNFGNIDFDECSFKGAKIAGVGFGIVTRCDFGGCDGANAIFDSIEGARFARARLKEAHLGIHVAEADFSGAVLDGAQFRDDGYWSLVRHRNKPPAAAAGTVFRDASLKAASFHDAVLKLPDFGGADLSGAVFSGCTMMGPRFEKATLEGATFINCRLTDARFAGANLRSANLAGADLSDARFDGADLADCNLRGAKLDRVDFSKARNYDPTGGTAGSVGPALTELDAVANSARRIHVDFRVRRPGADASADGELVGIDTNGLRYGWGLRIPEEFNVRYHRHAGGPMTFSDAMMQLADLIGRWKVRYETIDVGSTKSTKSGKELKDLVTRGVAEAFAQPLPADDELAAATKAYREKVREETAGAREEREKRRAEAERQKAAEKKKIARTIEKKVGKVTDIATFLKALELRVEAEKIKKATKMLKASGFQLYNDVTADHLSGVVKSQTDKDLVYACRLNADGTYACCTQNLNICGGLRGSVCKHLLVLVIGLVKAGELEPTTVDEWVAKSHDVKAALDKEVMGEIFIRYKGAEAGEIDWRPTETLPEDYYAL